MSSRLAKSSLVRPARRALQQPKKHGKRSQVAARYKNKSRIAFGLMNEPHDVPDIVTWAGSVQAAVTAIREAGATMQTIFLPENEEERGEIPSRMVALGR
jgi:hypothetical protein